MTLQGDISGMLKLTAMEWPALPTMLKESSVVWCAASNVYSAGAKKDFDFLVVTYMGSTSVLIFLFSQFQFQFHFHQFHFPHPQHQLL
jgi:hypothetical protein